MTDLYNKYIKFNDLPNKIKGFVAINVKDS